MPPASRLYWMDALRGLAVFLVVLQHSTSFPRQRGTDLGLGFIDVSADILAPYRMPLLLLLSGMLLGPSVRKPLIGYYEGKVRKVLWPLLVWGVITGVAEAKVDLLLTLDYWKSGPMHMWFLGVLLIYYLIGPITRWVPPWVVVAVFVGILMLFNPEEFFYRRILYYGVFFFLGAALLPHLDKILKRGVWFPIVLGMVGVVVSLGSLAGWIEVNPYQALWSVATPVAGLAAIVWLGPNLPRMRWLEWAGRRSIILYCAHFPIMIWITMNMAHLAEYSPLRFYLFQMSLGLGVPVLLALLYPYSKFLFEFPKFTRSDDNRLPPPPAPRPGTGPHPPVDVTRQRGIR